MRSFASKSIRGVSGLGVAVALLFLLSGCPGSGTFTPDPVLRFSEVDSSAGTADVGENVVVSWIYENEDLLKAQRVRVISLTFAGLSASQFTELDVEERSVNFDFQGPCMIELVCDDEDGLADSISFEIGTEETPFMQATVRNSTANGYPRLGATTTRARTIVFHQFFGAFDPNSKKNGFLDDITPFGLSTSVPFRGLSFSPKESEGFDFRQGSGYQLLSNSNPELGVANSVVYGGGFSYDGSVFEVKTDDGPVEGSRLVTTFEAIYMTIVLQTFQTTAPVIVDIQLGNIAQGMVVALTSYGMAGRSVDSVTITPVSNLEDNGTISGSIKSGTLGMPVTDLNDNIFDAFVQIEDVAFDMPFLRDDDLQTRLF